MECINYARTKGAYKRPDLSANEKRKLLTGREWIEFSTLLKIPTFKKFPSPRNAPTEK